MGLFLLRKGNFAEAESHFARATRRLTFRNPNPYDGEPFYNLGLARFYQGKTGEAYDAFHKSIWNYAWQSAGNYALASISAGRGDLQLALEQIEASVRTNSDHSMACALKASLLRRLGRPGEARAVIDASLVLDPLDFRTMAERFLLSRSHEDFNALFFALEGDMQTLLDVTFDLAWSGLQDEAFVLLESCPLDERWDHPMRWYTLSWLAAALNKPARAAEFLVKAEGASPRYCFPARIEEMIVLKSAIARHPGGAGAHYYLGNLYYDKRRYDEAIRSWRRSVELDGSFSIPWRNLGMAEFNVLHNPQAADRMYEKAFAANPGDARLLYEWDQLRKRAHLAGPRDRLCWLEKHPELVARRDDLTVEFVTLLNQAGKFHEALSVLKKRRFSPWEGGEGLASAQYSYAHRALGTQALIARKPCEALKSFTAARNYPHNLGEGKHLLALGRDLDYFSGLAAEQCGDRERASGFWNAAASPLPEPGIYSYFQALAFRELGNDEAAQDVLSKLARFAAEKRKAVAKIDYFATSLPNLLLFEDDLEERNLIESLLLSALAGHGLGQTDKAIGELRQVIAMDPNHLFAISVLDWIEQEGKLADIEPEVRPES
jgi:tetratricopeptide (TPR) repeat protein